MSQLDQIDGRFGPFHCHPGSDLISDSLRLYGEWAQNEIDTIVQFIKPGDVVIDVGACMGTHAVAFASAVSPGGRVIAFEPVKSNFAVLARNAAVAGREAISINQQAVAEFPGSGIILEVEGNAGAGVLSTNLDPGAPIVETITLDQLDLTQVNLIKIDVEGLESSVIAGAKNTIRAHEPILSVEVNTLDAGMKCLEAIKAHDYVWFGDIQFAFNPDNFFSAEKNIFNQGAECSLVLVPASRLPDLLETIEHLRLQPIKSADDLSLLLLQKLQYREGELADMAKTAGVDDPFGECKKLRQDVSQLGRSIVNLNNEVSACDATGARLTAEVAELRNQVSAREADVAELNAEIAELTTQIAQSNSKLLLLDQRLSSAAKASDEQARASKAAIKDLLGLLDKSNGFFKELVPLEDAAVKLARKARSFPFSLFFRVRKKYRRMTRDLIRLESHYRDRLVRHRQQVQRSVNHHRRLLEVDVSDTLEIYNLCLDDFDREFYLRNYPDVVSSGVDPLEHYLSTGWKSGRDPAPWFDTDYYVACHPDVPASGLNPFAHYLRHGRSMGYLPTHPGGTKALILDKLSKPLPTVHASEGDPNVSAETIATQVQPVFDGADRKLLLSISHSNWNDAIGGTEVCVQIESEICREAGIVHLSVFPAVQTWTLAARPDTDDDVVLGILVNQAYIGTASYKTIGDALRQIAESGFTTETTIHQMLGHQPEQIAELVKATGRSNARLYLHDYFTACEQWNLLRNQVTFCGGPPPGSGACSICHFGSKRSEHLARIRGFFDALDVTVVSPSQAALDVWEKATDIQCAGSVVVPHISLKSEKRAVTKSPDPDRPVRIGFIGATSFHKGWEDFKAIYEDLNGHPGFEFHYFGTFAPALSITAHQVRVTATDREAMSNAIEAADIDFILHFAPWPETFSFTAFEALRAGAYIIANPDAGNVAAVVRESGRGEILASRDAVRDWLVSDEFTALLTKRRKESAEFQHSAGYSDMAVFLEYEGIVK